MFVCARSAVVVCFLFQALGGAPKASAWEPSSRLTWHESYGPARLLAAEQQKMLLVNFVPKQSSAAQREFESYIAAHPAVQKSLQDFVLVRVAADVEVSIQGRKLRLLSHPAFSAMQGQPGIVIVDLKHPNREYSGRVVSVFPFGGGKYYRWSASYLPAALSLPAGTLTQRSMVWAVRTHPEGPASTSGAQSDVLRLAAYQHSAHQARIGVQGHHQFEVRSNQLNGQVGYGSVSEVVAESWPGQTLMDSCVDCVHSWRQSSGHWGAVRRRHSLFGYDIRRGRNGIWYATGLFSN